MPLWFPRSTCFYAPDMVEWYGEMLAQSTQNTCLVCQSSDEDAQALAEFYLTKKIKNINN